MSVPSTAISSTPSAGGTAPPPGRRSIRETFEALRAGSGTAAPPAAGRIALMPFVAAGYPDLATTVATLPALEAGGANVIEVGFPFSDPIADGPTIQAAFTAALSKKLKIAGTAYVRRMKPHSDEGPEKIAGVLRDYTAELLSEVRG